MQSILDSVDRHLFACSLIAGGALVGAAPEARADIISSSTTHSTLTGYTVFFDLGTAGASEATSILSSTSAFAGFAGAYAGFEFAITVGPFKTYFYGNPYLAPGTYVYHSAVYLGPGSGYDFDPLAKLGYGDPIAPAFYWNKQVVPASYDGGYTTPAFIWPTGTVGYIGFKIKRGAYSYYGWALLDIVAPGETTVGGFAWEDTAGMDITAGAVPEPGSVALGLLALGAAALGSWRRRRDEDEAAA